MGGAQGVGKGLRPSEGPMTLPIFLYEETSRTNKLSLEAFYSYSNEKDVFMTADDGL